MALIPVKPSQVPLAYNSGSDVDITNDVLIVGSSASGGQVAKLSPTQLRDAIIPTAGQRYWNVDPGPGFGDEYSYTDNVVLTAAQDGATVNNAGAAKAITITLPPAIAGRELAIQRIANFAITIKSVSPDSINGGTPGGSYVIGVRGMAVVSCRADGSWEVILGADNSGVYNIKDYGAVGNGIADDTAGIQATIDAIGDEGQILVPAGNFYHGPLTYSGTGGIRFVGVGDKASTLTFVPTADNQIAFSVDRTGTSAAAFVGFENMYLNTANTTYNKVCLNLVDVEESTLNNVHITGYVGNGTDSVGIHTQGRQGLWASRLTVTALVPLRIGVNPDTTDGYLSGDHFHFSDTYFLNHDTHTTNTLTKTCVLIDDGAHVSNLVFDGVNAWVRYDGYGLYWKQTGGVSHYTYSSAVMLSGVRTEQASSATKSAVHIEHIATYGLRNLTMLNCEVDESADGLYLRYVDNVELISHHSMQGAGRKIVDIDNASSMSWRGVKTQTTADSSAVTIGSTMGLISASPVPTGGYRYSPNMTWGYVNSAVTSQKPRRVGQLHEWNQYFAAVADDAVVSIPINGNVQSVTVAEIHVVATGTNFLEGMIVLAAPTGVGTNGLLMLSGSANSVIVSGGGATTDNMLNIYGDGGANLAADVKIRNRLGVTCDIMVYVVYKRSVET